jgi:hypothetical protein
LPKSPADTWLAAAFAEYEHVVALENALAREQEKSSREQEKSSREEKDKTKDRKETNALDQSSRDLADLALFVHESGWLTAARRLGRDVPLRETKPEAGHAEWYQIAKGKGVMLLAALRDGLGKKIFDSLMDEFGQAHAGAEVTSDQFVEHVVNAAGKPASEVFDLWLQAKSHPATDADHDPWTIHSFEIEPEQALIVYGTLADVAAQREAAEILQRTIARRFTNFSVPISSDNDVDDAKLGKNHVILIGRPETNRVTARCAAKVPVTFSPGSFTVRGKTYGNADSAVIAAGDNPMNPRYSTLVYAGLSAYSTWKCVHTREDEDLPSPQVVLLAAGEKPAHFRVPSKPGNVPQH